MNLDIIPSMLLLTLLASCKHIYTLLFIYLIVKKIVMVTYFWVYLPSPLATAICLSHYSTSSSSLWQHTSVEPRNSFTPSLLPLLPVVV